MPANSVEILCEACENLFSEDRYNEAKRVYQHHPTTVAFRQALEISCAICVRIWITFSRRTYKTIKPFDTIDGDEFECFTPITYGMFPPAQTSSCSAITFFTDQLQACLFLQTKTVRPHLYTQVSNNTGSDAALQFLIDKEDECQKKHNICRLSVPVSGYTPTRLIELIDCDNVSIQLRERLECIERYVALSHCWGSSQPLTLTRATATELFQGITLDRLPKTFQDAIAVTRRFGLRYLWIDSLCIYQDDKYDWGMEASRMKDIYRNAAFCIAATHAADSTAGLFHERDNRAVCPLDIDISWQNPRAMNGASMQEFQMLPTGLYSVVCEHLNEIWLIDDAPLNQRAWVAQERYLATRVLHFTEEAVFWQCFASWSTEAFPDGLPLFYGQLCQVRKETRLKTLVQEYRYKKVESGQEHEDSTRLLVNIRNYWRDFIRSYSGYKLTHESDIFVALQGIAQDIVTNTLEDRMVAGLSEERLMQELCWKSNSHECRPGESHRPAKWRAPSWSWASTKLPSKIPGLSLGCADGRYDMATLVKWHAPAKLSGELIEAALWVECRLLNLDVRQKDWYATIFIAGVENIFEETGIHMDDTCPSDQAGRIRSVFLMPTSHHNYTNGARNYIEGVALELSDEEEVAYKRIGCFNISIEWDGSQDHEASKEPFGHVMKILGETEPQVIKI
ncbi:heterokaryon incompatibility protein-domain-containing protein, partial [Phaeosphaeria sp. MPI-PUGE-AT-0046c]